MVDISGPNIDHFTVDYRTVLPLKRKALQEWDTVTHGLCATEKFKGKGVWKIRGAYQYTLFSFTSIKRVVAAHCISFF